MNGFLPGPACRLDPAGGGPLSGLGFAVKDLIDVEGFVTGGGNPDWAAGRPAAVSSAPAVTQLLRAGARLIGKTITDELAFSLEGENAHYGTPRNPRCPDRLPGGSSSGSAVAVAGGDVDFALGTDTGGSVRVPASFCGIFGFRPSHGRISLQGVSPFAPSFDTIGVLAADAACLQAVAQVLLGPCLGTVSQPRLLLAEDALALMEPAAAAKLQQSLEPLPIAAALDAFEGEADAFFEAYRVLQGREIAETMGPELARRKPRFGETIAPRFAEALATSEAAALPWRAWRQRTRERLGRILPAGSVLLLPAAPGIAPRKHLRGEEAGVFYRAALSLNAIASLCGCPALTLPWTALEGCPLGLCILASPGEDAALLALAAQLA